MATEDGITYNIVSESDLDRSDYICPVSHKIMLDPYITSCCRQRVSSSVAEKYSRESTSCPVCKNDVFTAEKDPEFQDQLQFYCPHHESSCEWKGPLKDIQVHMKSCDMRPWKCNFCDFESTYRIGTTEHAQNCQKCPVECLCNAVIPSCDYEEHLKVCPSQPMLCEFANVGCEASFSRESLSQHMIESASHHQLLVTQHSLKLTSEIHARLEASEVNFKLREEGARDKAEIEKLQREAEASKEELSVLGRGMERKEESLSKMRDHVIELEAKKEEHIGKMECIDRKFQEMMKLKEDQLQELKAKQEKMTIEHQNYVQRLQEQHAKDVKALADQLEEIGTRFAESRSLSNYETVSPVNIAEGEDVLFCQGKLHSTPIGNLKKAWGVAVGGDKLYAVDNSGSYGLHVIGIHESSSVTSMIESASFSEMHIPKNKCWYPRGVALDGELNIILTDTAHRVLKFSPQGVVKAVTGMEFTAGKLPGEFNRPIGVSISPEGLVFVCDCENHRVVVLDSSLVFVKELGGRGSGDGEFVNPWDVAFDSTGNAYVADCGNRCIKVFTPALEFLKTIGKGEGKFKKGDLRAPSALCIDSNNYLYVADRGFHKVLVYDPDSNYLTSFGKLHKPMGIAVDNSGRVYVSDTITTRFGLWSTGRVQMFT